MTPPGRWASAVLIAIVTLLVSWPAVHGDFLADDFGYVQLFGPKPFGEFVKFGDISEGIWGHRLDEPRPLFALSYKLSWLVSGADPRGFLLGNLLLHVGCALLVFAIARRATGLDSWTAVLAGLLFGLMPVHSEPIAWITGKVDSLATLFYLASFALFLRYRETGRPRDLRGCLAVFAAGLLAKEILMTLPALILAWDALFGSGPTLAERARAWLRRAADTIPFFLVIALYVTLRRLAFGAFARERRAGPGLLADFFERQGFNLRHLLLPLPGFADGARTGPAMLLLATLMGILLVASLASLLRRPRENRVTLSCILFFGVVFYSVNILPLLVTYRSARHLYLPSAGVAIALALLILPPGGEALRGARVRIVSAAMILVLFGWSLRAENARWVAAGRTSRLVRGEVEQLSRQLPKGAIAVLANVPVTDGERLAWNSVLPFALRPPFVPRDVTASLNLIEHPESYCCRPRAWWPARKPLLEALVAGAPEASCDVYLFLWNPDRGAILLRRARLAPARLRAAIEAILGARLEETRDVDEKTGARLVSTLAAAVRGAD